ncbi:hypothetical protein M427DRAFT_319607 [Gonapodya prolifera JEL478]|uniref:Uncharacterized protein n=1 Tax=Gonapodya prolifera (strain JEL478) TaxID=1344416 RepID=A0A139AXG8_GONPJ|nr:hypothetical protein M427DRAFT_319607 [Gonapodya prolifera JEL478]|eukprot:KXS21441.1 hypothetical protein M427DRAFT_319607 [Gonapodya prolifera JEL478]
MAVAGHSTTANTVKHSVYIALAAACQVEELTEIEDVHRLARRYPNFFVKRIRPGSTIEKILVTGTDPYKVLSNIRSRATKILQGYVKTDLATKLRESGIIDRFKETWQHNPLEKHLDDVVDMLEKFWEVNGITSGTELMNKTKPGEGTPKDAVPGTKLFSTVLCEAVCKLAEKEGVYSEKDLMAPGRRPFYDYVHKNGHEDIFKPYLKDDLSLSDLCHPGNTKKDGPMKKKKGVASRYIGWCRYVLDKQLRTKFGQEVFSTIIEGFCNTRIVETTHELEEREKLVAHFEKLWREKGLQTAEKVGIAIGALQAPGRNLKRKQPGGSVDNNKQSENEELNSVGRKRGRKRTRIELPGSGEKVGTSSDREVTPLSAQGETRDQTPGKDDQDDCSYAEAFGEVERFDAEDCVPSEPSRDSSPVRALRVDRTNNPLQLSPAPFAERPEALLQSVAAAAERVTPLAGVGRITSVNVYVEDPSGSFVFMDKLAVGLGDTWADVLHPVVREDDVSAPKQLSIRNKGTGCRYRWGAKVENEHGSGDVDVNICCEIRKKAIWN